MNTWTMWHVCGTGFDVAKVEPQKYRDFIVSHRESLERSVGKDTVSNIIYSLTERPSEIGETVPDMDDIRDEMDLCTIAEPVAYIMKTETNIRFCAPGVTDDGEEYVLFTAMNPWRMNETEKGLDTFEKLFGIMKKYGDELGLKTEEDVDLTYYG